MSSGAPRDAPPSGPLTPPGFPGCALRRRRPGRERRRQSQWWPPTTRRSQLHARPWSAVPGAEASLRPPSRLASQLAAPRPRLLASPFSPDPAVRCFFRSSPSLLPSFLPFFPKPFYSRIVLDFRKSCKHSTDSFLPPSLPSLSRPFLCSFLLSFFSPLSPHFFFALFPPFSYSAPPLLSRCSPLFSRNSGVSLSMSPHQASSPQPRPRGSLKLPLPTPTPKPSAARRRTACGGSPRKHLG